jgi:hypothetical protein
MGTSQNSGTYKCTKRLFAINESEQFNNKKAAFESVEHLHDAPWQRTHCHRGQDMVLKADEGWEGFALHACKQYRSISKHRQAIIPVINLISAILHTHQQSLM